MNAKFRNAGQACIASNRILAHKNIYDQFADMLSKKVKSNLICGDGFQPQTTIGPLINKQGLDKVYLLVSKFLTCYDNYTFNCVNFLSYHVL
jgi:acyl-CoA reductase-like NAD-dependent aldehyde dehydrogenase